MLWSAKQKDATSLLAPKPHKQNAYKHIITDAGIKHFLEIKHSFSLPPDTCNKIESYCIEENF